MTDEALNELRTKLVGETARVPFAELQRFFAQGVLLSAAQDLDLIDVGAVVAQDDADQFRAWLAEGRIGLVSDEQANCWRAEEATLWTMVVKPWVLVQEARSTAVADS